MTEEDERSAEHADDEHLADLPEGSGCTEIWEHLSRTREEDDADG